MGFNKIAGLYPDILLDCSKGGYIDNQIAVLFGEIGDIQLMVAKNRAKKSKDDPDFILWSYQGEKAEGVECRGIEALKALLDGGMGERDVGF